MWPIAGEGAAPFPGGSPYLPIIPKFIGGTCVSEIKTPPQSILSRADNKGKIKSGVSAQFRTGAEATRYKPGKEISGLGASRPTPWRASTGNSGRLKQTKKTKRTTHHPDARRADQMECAKNC